MTPTISNGARPIITRRPITPRSPWNSFCHPGVTQHDHRPAFKSPSSSGSNGRPRAAWTPSTWKKFPVTKNDRARRPSIVRRPPLQHRDDIREDTGLAAHRLVLGPRERHVFIRAGACRPLQLHGKQLARTAHGIDAKKKEGVDREDDGDESEAECDRRDDGESGQRCTSERPETRRRCRVSGCR